MFRFHKGYFVITIVLFFTEVSIALLLHDQFVRPYVGDFLVVILIYCFFKTFLNISVARLSIAVLLFAYGIEMLQYFKLIDYLGLQNSGLAKTILGNSFEWTDMLAYTLGIILVVFVEKYRSKKLLQKSP